MGLTLYHVASPLGCHAANPIFEGAGLNLDKDIDLLMTNRTYVLTDIHGRFDLLELALAEIDRRGGFKRLIFLGDYVDRGPRSREVVERLIGLDRLDSVVCLLGNHEKMFVDFADSEGKRGDMFLSNGGRETVESYLDGAGELDLATMSRHASWMSSLPLWFEDERRVYVHAGIRPGEAIEDQPPSVLIWSRMHDFFSATRAQMGAYVVHGHTPVHDDKDYADLDITDARANLDTGAYKTGKLTIGVFDDSQERPVDIFSVYAETIQ